MMANKIHGDSRESREQIKWIANLAYRIPKQITFFSKSCTYIYLYIWSSEIIGASRLILCRITYTNVRKNHSFTASECVATAECTDQIANLKKRLHVSDPYSILMYVNCISLVAETRSYTWRRKKPNHVLFCRNFCHYYLLLGYYHQKWLTSFQNYWSTSECRRYLIRRIMWRAVIEIKIRKQATNDARGFLFNFICMSHAPHQLRDLLSTISRHFGHLMNQLISNVDINCTAQTSTVIKISFTVGR